MVADSSEHLIVRPALTFGMSVAAETQVRGTGCATFKAPNSSPCSIPYIIASIPLVRCPIAVTRKFYPRSDQVPRWTFRFNLSRYTNKIASDLTSHDEDMTTKDSRLRRSSASRSFQLRGPQLRAQGLYIGFCTKWEEANGI
jgi:hypothetical protein